MHLRAIQTSYLLGISLILTGIIYFFAANWQYFDRIQKVSLSIFLLILFYLIHFILKKVINYRPLLSDWSLFAASIVFGVAVALIGQIYNSHADSYQLFLVWLIPVLALAFMTKYMPFYVLAFILTNLTMILFVYPSSYLPDWSPNTLFILLMVIAITNASIFLITYKNWLKSKTILYLAYIMTFSLLFNLALNNSMPIHILFNMFYAILLLFAIYWFLKQKPQNGLFTITVIFGAIFLIYRVINWALMNGGEWILYLLLFFAVVLTLISVVIVGILNRNKMNPFLSNVLIVVITIIATLFATVAIIGIFFITFTSATPNALYFFAIIALIMPGLLMIHLSAQIRYTLLGTGFIIAFLSTIFTNHVLYQYVLLILLAVGIYIVKTKGIKVLLYLFAHVVIYSILIFDYSFHFIYLIIFAVNTTYYILQRKDQSTNYTAFVLALLNFMALTFLDLHIGLVIVYNLAFFIAISAIILLIDRKRHKFKWTVSFVLWFVFIGYNYYEYLWNLIHKSIVAIIIGIIFIGIAIYFDRKTSGLQTERKSISYRTPLLLIIIFTQIVFIGFQSFTSEKLLQEGELIKLELQPVDPRSMLQGDYVILNYEINDLDIDVDSWKEKVEVLLREKDGIYEYAGNYKINDRWANNYKEQPGDVLINGTTFNYHSVVYGIESYFVPDGTGRELETSAEFAYVRVSESGNAILEKVE